jgi:hypothetical protein
MGSFKMGSFKMGSHELSAWAGLESPFFSSLLPEYYLIVFKQRCLQNSSMKFIILLLQE